MTNRTILIKTLRRLYAELDTDLEPLPIWIELGKCFLFAEELLSKKDYEILLRSIFVRKMHFSSIDYCKDVAHNFIHHYLESVEARIQKRNQFYPTAQLEMYDVTSLGDNHKKMISGYNRPLIKMRQE